MIVVPSDFTISSRSCMISCPVALSRFPVGSSASKIEGRLTRRARVMRAVARRRKARWAGGLAVSLDGLAPKLPARDPARSPRSTSARRNGSSTFSSRVMRGSKIECLEDHADGMAAITGEFQRTHFREISLLGDDASGGGAIEARQKIEQRGFSGARAAEQRQEIRRC